jgi:phosphoglucosamine mutase
MTTPITQRLFGTDGVRGEAGRFPLDAQTMETIGASLAVRLGNSPLIIVGRDTRESGVWLENALITGALRHGARCQSAGVITTPGVAFLTSNLHAQAGVVISASHNPYQDNGVKIFAPTGRKLDDDTERLIEADIFAAQVSANSQAKETQAKETIDTQDHGAKLRARYLDFLEKEIGAGLSLHGQTIVVDTANGAASQLAPELFARLGARVIAINNRPDGRNINLNCGSLHIEGLQQEVAANVATLGVAFDGDADRALFVDAGGKFVDGDATLWVVANYMHARGELKQNLVVATVMSNIGLEIALRSRELQLLRTAVGDKYVLEELLRTGASLGGEQSGHIIFPAISLAGDGMITTLCLLRAMTEEAKPLHELTEGFQRFPQILINVKVQEKRPFEEVASIKNLAAKTELILGDKGRLLLRYSGTEPLARVMIEGESQAEIEQYANDLAAVIRNELG